MYCLDAKQSPQYLCMMHILLYQSNSLEDGGGWWRWGRRFEPRWQLRRGGGHAGHLLLLCTKSIKITISIHRPHKGSAPSDWSRERSC